MGACGAHADNVMALGQGGALFVAMQHEMLLFAGVFFLIGALDEFAVDIAYLWLRLTGRLGTGRIDAGDLAANTLAGDAAVFIPCWQEVRVIGATVRHALAVWPDPELTILIGCYANDPATLAVARALEKEDSRVRVVVNPQFGPTSKADCLNCLYRALEDEEAMRGRAFRMVVLHDAEDMVDPLALKLFDIALDHAAFVQLPVLALPKPGSRFVAGHYVDEFCEAHAKTMTVRDALGAGVPGAGVGCAVRRDALSRIAAARNGRGPFAVDSLTEDYEFGLDIAMMGMRTRFLRMRTKEGRLIATRAYFPGRIGESVRQKTRWVHGIALQGWDRIGWGKGAARRWFDLRDRRGPLAALLLFVAYGLLAAMALSWAARGFGLIETVRMGPLLQLLVAANFAALVWRSAIRAVFTGREFGWREAALAVARIPVSNTIAILAGRRALFAYLRTLRGAPIVWEKTEHRDHPAIDAREPA